MDITITDINPEFLQHAQTHFSSTPEIQFTNQPFEAHVYDCLICPGNPHGYNVSGMDRAIASFFGDWIHTAIKDQIEENFGGELPSGNAVLIHTDNERIPFLVYTTAFPKRDDSAYRAMMGALSVIVEHNHDLGMIGRIACPGLGTYLGMLAEDVEDCAAQMAEAYRDVVSR
eukprot:TRINITY_DN7668_c0_g1_i1.p1 TRINITY_DN7668_c0_g1~~TRINITY_DN7668_c0_g1_i1.p1  ORF type:complete len:172 (+),score=26.62 TRINITY_DN7668_c0_g1_i1:2-517(+)